MKRATAVILLFALLFMSGCSNGPTEYEKAVACIGQSTDVLREQVGLPNKVYYTSAKNGGLEGELLYQGFTVYIYRDLNGLENVTDVVEDSGETKSDYEIATEYIGKPLSELQDQIGLPNNLRYANSCLGDGDDGELYYDGFTVYTYRDTDGTENVYDVIAD